MIGDAFTPYSNNTYITKNVVINNVDAKKGGYLCVDASAIILKVTTGDNTQTSIDNHGKIGDITTGKNSDTRIRNVGNIDRISSGDTSITTVVNNNSINDISGGIQSNLIITNTKNIRSITTGTASRNIINNIGDGHATLLRTGNDNETWINDDGGFSNVDKGIGSEIKYLLDNFDMRASELIEDKLLWKAFVFATQQRMLPSFFDKAGFEIDENGIYHAKQDGWQSNKFVGYNKFYDGAFEFASSMDFKYFNFSDGDEQFRLWFWKGDYLNLGAGSEVGIYYNGGPHWYTGTQYAMPMTLSLKDKEGNTIYDWQPQENNWWCTGFNPMYQNVRDSDLIVSGSINFTNYPKMYEAFKKLYDGNEMLEFVPNSPIVKFKW